MEKASVTQEDYLEAILMLGGTPDKPVRSVDLAQKMEVSKASVSKAVGLLKKKGFIAHHYYGAIVITEDGYEYANQIYKKHRYLTAFLSKELGIPLKKAEEEACMMEHAISKESFEKWAQYIDNLGIMDKKDKIIPDKERFKNINKKSK